MTDVLATSESLNAETTQVNETRTQESAAKGQDTPKKEYNNREEVIARLQILIGQPTEEVKDEVESLKQLYYKLRKHEIETEKAAFIEAGNAENEFVVEPDPLEEGLKILLNDFKAKKAAALEAKELRRRENLIHKQELLEEIRKIAEDPDNINKFFNEFQELSKQFKEITDIPPTHINELWKNFQKYTENFYDLLKINKELRDYDFKKNQEHKEALCNEAEELQNEKDVIAAFRRLQELHDEWRQTGPVAQAFREELWNRFKDASTNINKKHQQFFENIKETEAENERLKEELCQKIENFNLDELKSFQAWENKTKEVIALQEDWKKVGFAAKKINNLLFDRFRKACDNFFATKSEYFQEMKDQLSSNLDQKKALCAKAEELKESTDWKHTTDLMIALQKEWKKVGPVPRKYSDALWNRFIAACDYFFEQKEKHSANSRSAEQQNMDAKKDLIERLRKMAEEENGTSEFKDLQDAMAEWKNIGHVPFKEKDKLYKEYQRLLDILFQRFNKQGRKAHLDNFTANVGKLADGNHSQNTLYREREKLMRSFEHLKAELKTYENNVGFLSSSSKGGNALVKEMERKIEKLKEDMNIIAQKIDVIDENLK
ncbi:MAG: DUF349 domain-containing protein [Bacteroidales bacterium]